MKADDLPDDVPWAASEDTLWSWFIKVDKWAETGREWESKVAALNEQLGLQILNHLLMVERHLESLS